MTKKVKILIPLFTIFVIAGGIFAYTSWSYNPSSSSIFNPKPQEEKKYYSLIGTEVSEEVSHKRPLAIVIENHPDARPQAGVIDADIVYETLAEGGISRFLAIFQTKDVDRIGPVRSARPYFASIANEYHALFGHVGGSDEVLEDLQKGKYKNLYDANEYFYEKYFGRDKKRAAPHNVYTSTDKLTKLLKDKNQPAEEELQSWNFVGNTQVGQKADTINVNISTASYAVRFDYDLENKVYKRTLGGKPHLDEISKKQITAENVVIVKTRIADIPNDPKLRVTINLDTKGEVTIFRNGFAETGTWKKDASSKTRFYSGTGTELTLTPGKVWVMIIPDQPKDLLTFSELSTNPEIK